MSIHTPLSITERYIRRRTVAANLIGTVAGATICAGGLISVCLRARLDMQRLCKVPPAACLPLVNFNMWVTLALFAMLVTALSLLIGTICKLLFNVGNEATLDREMLNRVAALCVITAIFTIYVAVIHLAR